MTGKRTDRTIRKPGGGSHKTRRVLLILAVLVFALGAAHLAISHYHHTHVPKADGDVSAYSIHGIDISSHQGEVDWHAIRKQDIAFVYVKATEGSTFKDPMFEEYWEGARAQDVFIGAYHFVSFETPGETQARNFIETVPKEKYSLPPVVDLELYGKFETEEPTRDEVHAILDPLIAALEEEYGVPPVIYCTSYLYTVYVAGYYDNPIWLCDPGLPGTLPDEGRWTFCQYDFYGRVDGIDDDQVDLNVFNGSEEDFLELLIR